MRSLLLLLFLLIGSIAIGQKNSESDKEKLTFARYALGVSPSSFVNNFPSVQLSHDIGLRHNVNFATETAYIYGGYLGRELFGTRGFRLKSGIQWMAASNEYVAVNFGVSYVLRYTYARRSFLINFWEDEYFEEVRFDRTKLVSAAEFNISLLFRLTSRARLEFGWGIGPGSIQVRDLNSTQKREEEFEQWDEWTFNAYESEGDYFFWLGSFNINFNYILVR